VHKDKWNDALKITKNQARSSAHVHKNKWDHTETQRDDQWKLKSRTDHPRTLEHDMEEGRTMQRRSIRPCSGNSRGDLVWLRCDEPIDVSDLLDAAFIVTAQNFDDQRKEPSVQRTRRTMTGKTRTKSSHTYIEKECKLASCFVN
jgi:hypothetical protein